MAESAWIACIASDIERDRLIRIASTWAHPGVDGLCLVTDDPDPPRLHPRQRNVRPAAPFTRSSWRNIAMRFCPSDIVMFMDADCVVAKSEEFGAALDLVRDSPETMVIFSPAWCKAGDGDVEFLRGDIGPDKLRYWFHEVPRVVIAGTLAVHRDKAIWLSFDDDMALWGAEDADFCGRARTWGLNVLRATPGALVHVHHKRRNAARAYKNRNLRIAAARAASADVAEWNVRALHEIAMVSAGTEDAFISPTEAVVRDMWLHRAQKSGWSALAQLTAGTVPDGCIYKPIVGCTVEDLA